MSGGFPDCPGTPGINVLWHLLSPASTVIPMAYQANLVRRQFTFDIGGVQHDLVVGESVVFGELHGAPLPFGRINYTSA